MSEIIQDPSLEDVIGDRFGRYSKYIIQERALPDVRDGLKPYNVEFYLLCIVVAIRMIKISVKVRKQLGMLLVNIIHMVIFQFNAMVRLSQD